MDFFNWYNDQVDINYNRCDFCIVLDDQVDVSHLFGCRQTFYDATFAVYSVTFCISLYG